MSDAAHDLHLLVLGSNGRLGRMLGQIWGDELGPDRTTWQARAAIERAGAVQFDPLTDPGMLAHHIKAADAVLCLAGPTAADADHDVHAALVRAILTARGTRHVPVVFMSSAAIYGPHAGVIALPETAPAAAIGAYAVGKAAMEDAACGAPAIHVLRLGNVAGADALLGGVRAGRPVLLDRFTDGSTPSRSYIGPVTLARVLDALLRRAVSGAGLPGIINLAAGTVTMGALLDAAGIVWTPRPARPDAVRALHLDTSALDAVVDIPVSARGADGMVAQWQSLRTDTQ